MADESKQPEKKPQGSKRGKRGRGKQPKRRKPLGFKVELPEPSYEVIKERKTAAAARPMVTVYGLSGKSTKRRLAMPDIMLTPIRNDLVQHVHDRMALNKRIPYAVKNAEGPHGIRAGHQVAAKSWGTGRAVSRVPRVKGGGTHRAGQGAYANMCKGGRMFSPTKVWRKWQRKTNVKKRRYAVASAVAASAVPALVMARGHRVEQLKEIPFVVEDSFSNLKKTRNAVMCFRRFKLQQELMRCKRRKKRAGKGKMRNRRYRHRRGPLVIYAPENQPKSMILSIRNIRGVEFCNVDKLNLLKLAPGGHLGRLIVWTEAAFKRLNTVWGTFQKGSRLKKRYRLPRPVMTNADINRIVHSQAVQAVLRPKRVKPKFLKKRNPLRYPEVYAELNPLFEQQWEEIKKRKPEYTKGKRPRTVDLLKPFKKKQKQAMKPKPLTKEEEEQMQGYWKNVFGEESIFKSSALLAVEKEAVKRALEAQEREKLGLDLMEMLAEDDDKDE